MFSPATIPLGPPYESVLVIAAAVIQNFNLPVLERKHISFCVLHWYRNENYLFPKRFLNPRQFTDVSFDNHQYLLLPRKVLSLSLFVT